MKRVSFETAKALKEAGYPQRNDYTYDLETKTLSLGFVSQNRFEAPTYLEVWLWLWREKGIFITFDNHITFISSLSGLDIELPELYSDPEAAIIAAIEYLVDNNLIK